ncbi:hypothetical protein M0804_006878 [Polistes exclamans]|nr:hypothetical protein M0804_006878 [Polistes exclamans]
MTTSTSGSTMAGSGVGGVPIGSTGGYSSSRFVEKTSKLNDDDDSAEDDDGDDKSGTNLIEQEKQEQEQNNRVQRERSKTISIDDHDENDHLLTFTCGNNVQHIIERLKNDDRKMNASKPNEDVGSSELVRPEDCNNAKDVKTMTDTNTNLTTTRTLTNTTNTSSHSSSRSVNSITDRRLEDSNHEAGEHQREDVVKDCRKVNGSRTVTEKLEDENTREYKTDKEEEDEEGVEGVEGEEEEDGLEKAEENSKDEEEASITGDESTSDSVEDEDERTVISIHKGSDSDRNARSSSLVSDKSIEDELFDDNGWLVTDQDLQLDGSIRSSKNQDNNLMIGQEDEKNINENLNASKSPDYSSRNRVYRQSSIGKNGWLISDESESESERTNSPTGSRKTTEDTIKNEENIERQEDSNKSEEPKKDDWSIEENGWMIVNDEDNESTIQNLSKTEEPPSLDKTELKRGRSSTNSSQTTTDLVTRANVENGALIANANRSKQTERSDEHEDATDVDISIPMQMVTTVFSLKERRQRLARSRSSHNFGGDEVDLDEEPPSPTTQSPNAYLAAKYGAGSELARSRSTHALKSREPSPERDRSGTEKDGAALSSWARYLKNKYGNRSAKDKEPPSTTTSIPSSSASATSRRLSLGLPLRHTGQTSFESSDDDQKNPSGSPTSPTAAPVIPAAAGSSTRSNYLLKRRQLFKFGMRGSEAGCFTWPRGLAIGPDNTIVVADSSNHRVQVFNSNGNFLKEFGTYGSGEGEFDCLAGVAVNRIGQYIIADRYNHRIQVLDPSGRFLRAFGSQGTADGRFNYPWGITTDALGFIYVCDKENHRVQVFQSDGTFVGKFGSCGSGRGQLEHPHYIAVSNTNRVIVSDGNNHRIQIFDVNGRVLSSFGSEGSDEGQFKFPRGVAVDEQGYIVVADSGNNRIQIFSPEGNFLKSFGGWGSGDGEFKGLEGVAVTSNGNVVICDRENHRVQVF